ncbi:MAG: mechanosensitive ion channel family protein [Candidatus Thermoplasmatota archaeon]|nr:mechanosensitive ion channel family protein [Candidatus Thermoplasmatota archaeon]
MMFAINLGEYINTLFQESGYQVDPIVGQSIAAVIFFALAIIIGWIVYRIFAYYFTKWAKKTKTTLDDEIIKNVKRPVYFLVLLIGFWYAVDQLVFLDAYYVYIGFIFLTAEILLIAYIITRVINVLVSWYANRLARKTKQEISTNILVIFKKLLHAVVYIFAFLILLYLSKIDLSGALVGLGVGGIAIAFALQNLLSDAFSAFSIFFDRPFEIGDFIVIGDDAGTVTHISMRSTRIKLLRGEELVISNRAILDKNIHNYKKLQKRRIVFTVGVTYGTPIEKLKKIEGMIREIIGKCQLCQIDRIHFREFGAFSLNFEVVYFIDSSDYNTYMDIQQQINFGIAEAFEKEKIEIAFPTQTIYLEKNQ